MQLHSLIESELYLYYLSNLWIKSYQIAHMNYDYEAQNYLQNTLNGPGHISVRVGTLGGLLFRNHVFKIFKPEHPLSFSHFLLTLIKLYHIFNPTQTYFFIFRVTRRNQLAVDKKFRKSEEQLQIALQLQEFKVSRITFLETIRLLISQCNE